MNMMLQLENILVTPYWGAALILGKDKLIDKSVPVPVSHLRLSAILNVLSTASSQSEHSIFVP